MYVLAVANLADGITLYGPFADAETANDYGDRDFDNVDWVVMDLCPWPEEATDVLPRLRP
jgi:hypothetical protein